MARLKQTAHLTPGYAPAFAAIVHQTHAGMAYFADTGPFAATCAECEFYGAWQPKRNAAGEIIATARVRNACAKYQTLMGKLGPAVPPDAPACRYFERREAGRERDL